MRERLLFVTKGGDDCDSGFSYAIELAKTLKAGIAVLMVFPRKIMEAYEDVLAAVAFAEAGEHETVRELVDEQSRALRETAAQRAESFLACCSEEGVPCTWSAIAEETVSAIRETLRTSPAIEMVLLGPSLVQDKKGIDLKKLLKEVTKPIVTLSRPMKADA